MTGFGGAEDEAGGAVEDRVLLARHVAGDADAFADLVARHRDRLWAVALRTCGNPEDAADGLQEGLVAAYRRAGSFRGDAAVTTWLHRVVVNACLDRLRAQRSRAASALPDDLDDRGLAPLASGGAESDARDPLDAAVAADRRARVLAALRTLPVEQRAALVLVDLEGHPVAEAAAILDCAPGTVKSRCSRGRARLAVLLADLVADDGDPGPPPGNQPAAAPVPSPGGARAPPR